MSSSARVGVGDGLVTCSSINFGRPGTLLGRSVGLWASASGGAAQSAYMFIGAASGDARLASRVTSRVKQARGAAKGAGRKTSIVARVSMMPIVSRVAMMLGGMPDEMGGHDHVFYVDTEPWRRCRDTRRRRRSGSDAELVRTMLTRISKASRMSTTPKGAGWKV